MGESKVDGDPSKFFFFEPVWIGTCERQDECALAVVDMPGGPRNYMPHIAFKGVKGQKGKGLRNQGRGRIQRQRLSRLGFPLPFSPLSLDP
ncbi:MAG: hypothetical protein DMG09_07290 [Acidobacteria bacterium]|nr:MAG: hypothetical protein DMG09_07290 [Acidobacteriota bacterium]